MIVIGADTHKQTHTCAAARAGTGELLGERTAAARKPGFSELLDWGRSLDGQRIWALEDCRHVPGSFERFLTAAKLLAETAGVQRFASDAKLARLAGVAPVPASSGNRQRHRLDRRGNRQLNCALHRMAVAQGRVHPPARDFLARKQAEGKSRIEALRALKRHLARAVWQALRAAAFDDRIEARADDVVPNLPPAGVLALT
jgi:transposase